MTVHKLLLQLIVDDEKFDLSEFTKDAVWAGWSNDPENGVVYLAEAIAELWVQPGLKIDWLI